MRNLSKTRYMAGLQCEKRLWLDDRRRELATPPDAATRMRLSAGHDVGKLARRLWPEGVLVTESPARHAKAVERTRTLVDDPGVPAVFEAAFEFRNVRVRVDALVRNGDAFAIFEVKSSSKPKPEHVDDLAVQTWVVDGSGIEISAASLVHLDDRYVWPGGAYDPVSLFVETDLTREVFERVHQVPARVESMRNVLGHDEEPAIETGPHCFRPYPCPFSAYCRAADPPNPILDLPRISPDLYGKLRARGIRAIEEISDASAESVGLNALQGRVRRAVISGRPEIDVESLEADLDAMRSPITFLDFETFASALPRYVGTRPHEPIPFQWSMHVLHAGGETAHEGFLWTDRADPRSKFLQALSEALPSSGSVVVYSPYERARLAALAAHSGSVSQRLYETFAAREVDLARIVRKSVYHPAYRGSFSLKNVLPALVPGYDYADLEIRDGGAAAAAFAELTSPNATAATRARLAREMRAYCARDTEALLRLYRALLEIVARIRR